MKLPSSSSILVFWGESCHLRAVEQSKVFPDLLQRGKEQCVSVHI
jgi:hypothetical protein